MRFAPLIRSVFWLFLSAATACSVGMVLEKPAPKDLIILREGTPRSVIINELGAPVRTVEVRPGTLCHDEFAFPRGYGTGERVARAVGYAVLDYFLIFTMEPGLMQAESREITIGIMVHYSPELQLHSSCVYQGHEAIAGKPGTPEPCPPSPCSRPPAEDTEQAP